MTAFSSSVAILCCGLLTASLVKLLSPKGNTEKLIKLVIGIFVLLCLVISVKGMFSFMMSTSQYEKRAAKSREHIESLYNDKILNTTAQYMADYTRTLLCSNNLSPKNIKVKVEADENMVINIKEISIYIDKDEIKNKDRITEIITSDLNIEPKIIAEEN